MANYVYNLRKIKRLLAKSRSVLVLGAGKSGYAASLVFAQTGRNVLLIDEYEVSKEVISELSEHGIKVYSNFDSAHVKNLPTVDFVIKSPGISPKGKLVSALLARDFNFVSELDLFYAFVGKPSVAVTGTNGKTTVCNLIHQMLSYSGQKSRLLGNMGPPLTGAILPSLINAESLESDYRKELNSVLEVSSYQLEDVEFFAPKVSVCLNLSPDHLERHENMDGYFQAKSKIFLWQDKTEDWSLINVDDEYSAKFLTLASGSHFPFGTFKKEYASVAWGCFWDPSCDEITFIAGKNAAKFNLEKFSLEGAHNRLNLTAAIAASLLTGANTAAIEHVIEDFKTLSHRLELVQEVQGVNYVNDSKSTNISSALSALDAFQNRGFKKVFLLLGGKAKAGGWESLANKVKEQNENLSTKVEIILFGGSRELIHSKLTEHSLPISNQNSFNDLKEAVSFCSNSSEAGDLVLLSPACASFDAYSSFSERGEDFKKIVESL